MIRRILVVLAGTRFTPSAIRIALDLARRHGAELTGLAVLDRRKLDSVGPVPAGASAHAERLRAHRFGVRREQVAAAVRDFRQACEAAGVIYGVEEGDVNDLITSRSRYHDLTVFGLRSLLEGSLGAEHSEAALARLIGDGVRPILAVAEELRPIRRALIAYSGSVGSARAMRCFLQLNPWPEVQIRVVTCHSSEEEGSRLLADAAEYCRAHGREPETRRLSGAPGRALLLEAGRWDADLVVAGNGARSLLRRRHIGETALHLMRRCGRPLFLGP
ncbi:MAG: universal stress protein [Deltaproteobacteria bacterium]|nr:universal stress protein [Deltaproteobacteria bacterium]